MKKENQLLRFTKNYSLKQQNLKYTYANELFLFSFHLALPPAHPTKKRYPAKKRFSLCKKINQMVRQYNKYLNVKQNTISLLLTKISDGKIVISDFYEGLKSNLEKE